MTLSRGRMRLEKQRKIVKARRRDWFKGVSYMGDAVISWVSSIRRSLFAHIQRRLAGNGEA